ncbi:hypothetical protein HC219_004522 [Shigella sonnei]|nr:hypothetical protein [Shigella sonnei]EFV6004469.1 hypothetical protein [Shigella sonnei]
MASAHFSGRHLHDWKPIRVVCRKWSASVGALWVTITADFEQVVA